MYHPFIFKSLNYCNKNNLINEQDKILIAVSGGVDSCYLLHFFSLISTQYKLNLSVIHFNHNLRNSSDNDQDFVLGLSQQLSIDCKVIKAKDEFESKKDFQNQARIWRLSYLKKLAKVESYKKIALGHHKDDLAETILWKISRGSSLLTLDQIKPIEGIIIRPLLDECKADIVKYMKSQSLKWIEDQSNKSIRYTRNKIRNNIIPYLKQELAEDIVNKLCLLAEDSKYFEFLFSDLTKDLIIDTKIQEVDKLKNLHIIIFNKFIYKWLIHWGISPNRNQINKLWQFIENEQKDNDKKVIEFSKGKKLIVEKNIIFIDKQNIKIETYHPY